MHIDIVIVTAYVVLLIYIGLRGGGARDASAFSAAGKTYSASVIFMSLAASYVGGGFSAGNAAYAFANGIGMTIALCTFSVATILTGKYLAPGVERFAGATTTGDIISRAYGKKAGLVCGVISFFTCAAVVGAQMQAMGTVLHALLGIPPQGGIVLGCGIVLLYSTVGGLGSVIAADTVQFVLLAAGMPILLIAALCRVGGIGGLLSATPPAFFEPLNGTTLPAFLSFAFTAACGEMLVPPYTQRLLIGKSPRATAKGTVAGGVFSIPFFIITGLIGLAARALAVTATPADAMPALILKVLPVGLRGLIMASMVSIMLSAADGFLNGAAVSLVHDTLLPLRPRMTDKTQLHLLRGVNVVVGVFAVTAALLIPNIFAILEISYTLWSPLMVVPLCNALLGKRTTPRAFTWGVASGFFVTVLWEYCLLRPFAVSGAPLGLLANLIAFIACEKQEIYLRRE